MAILYQDLLTLTEAEELIWIVVIHLEVDSWVKALQSYSDFYLALVATAEHVRTWISHDLSAISLQILLGHLRNLLMLMLLVVLLLLVSFIITHSRYAAIGLTKLRRWRLHHSTLVFNLLTVAHQHACLAVAIVYRGLMVGKFSWRDTLTVVKCVYYALSAVLVDSLGDISF